MIDKKLFLRLVLPLSILMVVGLALARPLDFKGLISNLVTEICGILITVSYVDWIIRERDKEKWKPTYLLIKADYASEVLQFLSEATLFLYEADWNPPSSATSTYKHRPWAFVVELVTEKEVIDALTIVDNDGLDRFSSAIDTRIKSIHSLLNRSSAQLNADDMNAILEYESLLKAVQSELSFVSKEYYLTELSNGDETKGNDLRLKYLQSLGKKFKSAITLALKLFGDFFPSKSQ